MFTMKSNLINCLDLEINEGEVIEVGLTVVDIESRQILKSWSYPVLVRRPITEHITRLTGWTDRKLQKSGESFLKIWNRLLEEHGLGGRLLVVDCNKEFPTLQGELVSFNNPKRVSPEILNVSSLFKIKHRKAGAHLSLEEMLQAEGLEFEGRQHRAKDDSFNIARLFLELIK